MEQASRATSSSTASMKAREAERYSKDIERAQNARANIARDISQKSNELVRAQERVDRSITNEEKKRAEAAKKLQKEQERRLRAIERASSVQPSRAIVRTVRSGSRGQSHDVFISHASEDKEDFVAGFAEAARSAGVDVWYDEFSLRWGDSLRQSIDKGLAGSYFGVVVLSKNFFDKNWTNYELDAILQKETVGKGGILPIWHKVTVDEVTDYSPALANRLALNTSTTSTADIVRELKKMVKEIRSL